jgi:hypothetical protein
MGYLLVSGGTLGMFLLAVQLVELRFDSNVITFWTDTMAELRRGVFGDVGFDLLPIVLIIADFLAV